MRGAAPGQWVPQTVQEVVRNDLQGAEVRQCVLTEEDGGTLERFYVVLWRRSNGPSGDYEYGTHRVCVHDELGEAMCVWGHYHNGRNAIADAYVDFNQRVAEGI